MQLCSIKNCNGKYHAKGLCKRHYARLLRHEDPLMVKPTGRKKFNMDKCKTRGCNSPQFAKHPFRKHYQRYPRVAA